MTLKELCNELSISEATGKNWLRLGKVKADLSDSIEPSFSKEYVASIKNDIASGKIQALNSRRNKKFVSGSFFYNSYVPKECDCLPKIRDLSDYLTSKEIILSGADICCILAYYAVQFFHDAFGEEVFDEYVEELIDELAFSYKISNTLPYKKSDSTFDTDKTINDTSEPSSYKGILKNLKDRHPYLVSLSFKYEPGVDTLGLLYMSLRDIGSRKNAGSYYTPTDIVRKSIDNLHIGSCYEDNDPNNDAPFKDASKDLTILDPCCGSGNFLIQLPDDIECQNIYGCDIDPICVLIARIGLVLRYGAAYIPVIKKNIRCGNFLSDKTCDLFENESFAPDYIIGNPPWGYDFGESENKLYKKTYKTACSRSVESFAIFTEKALLTLKKGGKLSFVLPEAALTVKIHKALRKLIISCCNITYLAYLGNVFSNVACPCVILQLLKTGDSINTKGMIVEDLSGTKASWKGSSSFVINSNRKVSDHRLSFYCNDEEYSILEAMHSPDRVYLKDNAIFALGIVTGGNERFIIDRIDGARGNSIGRKTPLSSYDINDSNNIDHKYANIPDGYEVVLKGSDISRYHISVPDRFIKFDPQSFQQVADEDVYRQPEKLMYRFINKDLIFAYDKDGMVSLNSCNILIPKLPGLDIKYILAVLNSSPAAFYYKKSFNSVKVLRSHLEQIPIPVVSKDEQAKIIELVDRIMDSQMHDSPISCHDAHFDITNMSEYEELDRLIASAYGLSSSQYGCIHGKIMYES
ncbi:TaqI-like C-terminal specificity domain-containing protein [Butyrivibrio fibrisolvens]|uniref:TaqI-like C-terminal specificity domain-containing protein n=1 Tax=Butyrivibrio fibrisolvens TaxID=831 RepID=UPI0004158CE3|nr:TaqI-like C-terminal specificity domain-containing protein [Butyrivibrio fibrisolvens]